MRVRQVEAGVAVAKILLTAGARQIVVCDRSGIISRQRLPGLNASKAWLAANTNPQNLTGSIAHAAAGAHLFIGVSGPGVFTVRELKRMAKGPIVFALANPTPEIMPDQAQKYVRIMATGRSDYPNQINNVLAFPDNYKITYVFIYFTQRPGKHFTSSCERINKLMNTGHFADFSLFNFNR